MLLSDQVLQARIHKLQQVKSHLYLTLYLNKALAVFFTRQIQYTPFRSLVQNRSFTRADLKVFKAGFNRRFCPCTYSTTVS